MNVLHEPVTERPHSLRVKRLKELGLQLRHVHVAGALALAGLAREAQVHHLGHPAVGIVRCLVADRRHSQRIGPSASRVLLVLRGAVARAHRAALRLAADPDPVAQFDAAEVATLRGVVERGRNLGQRLARRHAEVLFHRRAIDNLAGVQHVRGVEAAFHVSEGFVHGGAEHLAVPLAANHAVAVFAAQAAAKGEDEVGDVVHDRAHLADVGRVVEVEHGADVQATDAGVAVEGPIRAVLLKRFPEAGGELGQLFRRDGTVFHERDGLAVAHHPEEQW